jgi:UrcA family protein
MTMFGKIIAAVALTASVATHAQQSINVGVGDLDLATAKGQRIMTLRVDRAARTLCASESVSQNPKMMRAERACRAAAKQQAVTSVASRTAVLVAGR